MRWLWVLALLLALGGCVATSVVVLDEREQAFRTVLGEAEPAVFPLSLNEPLLVEPGWYLRIPFLHELHRYDRRQLRFDAKPSRLNTSEKLVLEVDYYAIWRIADPRRFFESVRTGEAALRRIDSITYSEVHKTLAQHTLADLLSERREPVMRSIARNCAERLAPFGIRVEDLRIRSAEYPEANLAQIYDRMRSERTRFAMRYRAEGEERARTTRAKADQEAAVIRAEAAREATRLRGVGDAEAARVYAEAYGQDPEFYAFVRSLEAYRGALDGETTLVLSPTLPFLRYFFPEPGAKPPTP